MIGKILYFAPHKVITLHQCIAYGIETRLIDQAG